MFDGMCDSAVKNNVKWWMLNDIHWMMNIKRHIVKRYDVQRHQLMQPLKYILNVHRYT